MQELEIFVLSPQIQTVQPHFYELIRVFIDNFIWFVETFGTLLSVVAAVLLYQWKIRIDKQNAARILLMEIRSAEGAIDTIKASGVIAEMTFVMHIMPVSSWKKFQHFFVKDFDIDELDSLNHFYNLCLLIQKEVNRMKDLLPISNEEKIKLTQHKLLDLAEKCAGDKDKYLLAKKTILDECFFPEKEWFIPELPKERVIQHLGSIKPILVTTCGQKLKKIARLN